MRRRLLFLFAGFPSLILGQEVETLRPLYSFPMDADLKESSGLIYWDGDLWTHNDSRDNTIYRLDPGNGNIKDRILLEGIVNNDWEDIAQDKDFIYLGDIGNNNGSRKDLHILRIDKLSLSKGELEIDTISFIYSEQDDFTPRAHATDFDCEAMIVHKGRIFLFTKEWISAGTSVYTLPALPGHYTANMITEFPVMGLVTGADISADGNTIILIGYNTVIQPFLYIFSDLSGRGFEGMDLSGGSHQKKIILLPHHQAEGIAFKNTEESGLIKLGIFGSVSISNRLML